MEAPITGVPLNALQEPFHGEAQNEVFSESRGPAFHEQDVNVKSDGAPFGTKMGGNISFFAVTGSPTHRTEPLAMVVHVPIF